MTREEAIAHGKEQLEVFGGEHAEFIKLAIKALEQKPYEKFESAKDHIYKLAGDYKCWDNRLTQDEAVELCHILEQQPRWIPVSERLPKDRELVLLSTVTDNVFEGRFFDDNTDCQWYAFRVDAIVPNHIVTAWMPLPKVYREVDV